jgi:hypothetical protein
MWCERGGRLDGTLEVGGRAEAVRVGDPVVFLK